VAAVVWIWIWTEVCARVLGMGNATGMCVSVS
jgi:hypothetical protein